MSEERTPGEVVEAAKIARVATGPAVPEALRVLLVAFASERSRDQSAGFRGLEGFIAARARGLGMSTSDQDEIVGKVLAKIVARPELFLNAANPAAYITVSVKNSWLSLLRKHVREVERTKKLEQEATKTREPEPIDLLAESEARADLDAIASEVIRASRPDELRAQRTKAWQELWDLFSGDLTMDEILDRHTEDDPTLSAEREVDPVAVEKKVRDRVLQRHHRIRKLVNATIGELVEDPHRPEWTAERGRDARAVLHLLLVRCHHKPRAAGGGGAR